MSRREPTPRLPLGGHDERFPGFDVLDQSSTWDPATSSVVFGRLGPQPAMRFFDEHQEAIASALFDQLLDQREEPRVPVVQMVDARLAEAQTDGWHFDGMPRDQDAWPRTLTWLDRDSEELWGVGFARAEWDDQGRVLTQVQQLGAEPWHDWPATHTWSLWTRYACTAFYSHPYAWNEIGFAGPAYPRGYKNLGIDRREPFEVADHHPDDDPIQDWTR